MQLVSMRKSVGLLIIFLVFSKKNLAVASEGQCYQIDNLEIQGAYELSRNEIRGLKEAYEGRCLQVEDIKDLVRVITNLYVSKGNITTRAYIREQNLLEKKLIINVCEGALESVEYVNKKTFLNDILPLRTGHILNLRDIEQGIDNISRWGNAKIYLKPGMKEGGSIAVIDNKPSKGWRINSGIDNSGSKNKGRYQSFTNFSFGNLFSLNENYLLSYRASVGDHSKNFSSSYNLVVSGAYKYNNFMFQHNNAAYKTLINTPRNKYINHGGSKVYKFIADRVVHRDGESKTNISVGGEADDYSNYIADNKIETSSYRIHKADLGIKHQRRLAASSMSFSVNFTVGENKDYRKSAASMKIPAKKFNKINYGISWVLPLGAITEKQFIKYLLQVNGQYSPRMLVATEKDTVGGLSSVRGFQDYVENSDDSLVVRNELSVNLPTLSRVGKAIFGEVDLFGGYDLGRFYSYEAKGVRSGLMSGVATGFRSNGGYCNLSVTVALPLESPVPIKRQKVVYASVAFDL